MSVRRMSVFVLLVVAVGLSVCAVILSARADSFEPLEGAEAQAHLDALRTGCEAAASAIQSGVGAFTVHDIMWQENGARRETEGAYQLVQRGDRVKVQSETRIIVDEWGIPGQNAPSIVSRTSLAFDGEVATYYAPDNKRALVGDRSSGFPGKLLEGVLATTHAPGSAAPAKVFDPQTWSGRNVIGPSVVGRETLDGQECIVCEVTEERIRNEGTFTRTTYRYWIDPSRAFSLVRFESHVRLGPNEEPVLTTRADIETSPCGNGLWRISSWRQDQYTMNPDTGNWYLSDRSTVMYADDYQLNAPITDEMLALRLPSGTRVKNELIDSEYMVP